MSLNFQLSTKYDLLNIDVPADGNKEILSRAGTNVLRGKRKGFVVYANNELFAICDTTTDYTFEFLRNISQDEYHDFSKFIKSQDIKEIHIWDLHNSFNHKLFPIKEEVHLMETYIDDNIVQRNHSIVSFKSSVSLLKKVYSDSFNVTDKTILYKWIRELKSEEWFSEKKVYIVGYENPAAFLILRERSPLIFEIFLFGITSNYKGHNLSDELFNDLLFMVNLRHELSNIKIQIWVHNSNEVAYRLYEKHNFKSIRIRRKYLVNL